MKRIKNRSLVRNVISLVAGYTSYAVASQVIKDNTSEPDSEVRKAVLAVGTFIIAQVVSGAVVNQVEKSIDEALNGWNEAVSEAPAKA